MTIARHYVMIAAAGRADDLHAALVALAGFVRPVAGCEGIALFRDADAPDRFTFIEYWASIAAHREGGRTLGKEAFAPVMAALSSPPEGRYLEQLPVAG